MPSRAVRGRCPTSCSSLPRGRWQVEYSVRLNAGGRFVLPATRVESMYEADRFAAVPNPTLEVGPTP